MEKRAQARLSPDGAIPCRVEWEKGFEDGRIHNISPRGALLEARSDFGISRLKLVVEVDSLPEPLSLEAAIRWHAVSPQDEPDHYGLVFRNLDEETQQQLDTAIDRLTNADE